MPPMTRYFQLDEANGLLAELDPLLLTLAQQRHQLVRLRDELLESEANEAGVGTTRPGAAGRDDPGLGTAGPSGIDDGTGSAPGTLAAHDDGLRLAHLRMQGLIDQMQAAVVRLDELGVVLRDIETGLIDFPALVNGRQIWLCWRLGEAEIDYWHELSSGVAGRERIINLV